MHFQPIKCLKFKQLEPKTHLHFFKTSGCSVFNRRKKVPSKLIQLDEPFGLEHTFFKCDWNVKFSSNAPKLFVVKMQYFKRCVCSVFNKHFFEERILPPLQSSCVSVFFLFWRFQFVKKMWFKIKRLRMVH